MPVLGRAWRKKVPNKFRSLGEGWRKSHNPRVNAPVAPAQDSLKVGDWTVEPGLNQICAGGSAVKLEPKAMAVLVLLADRPGQVLSREALLSQVWPGLVVTDDALTQVITKLRKALGDDPDRPTYIQTVTKKGYRLVAPVLSPAQSASVPLARPGRRARWLAGAVTASLLVAAGLWWSVEQHAMRLASSVELVSTGVTPTLSAMRSRASWMRFQVRPEGLPGMGASAWHALPAGQAGAPRASVPGAHRDRAAVLARIEPGQRRGDVHRIRRRGGGARRGLAQQRHDGAGVEAG